MKKKENVYTYDNSYPKNEFKKIEWKWEQKDLLCMHKQILEKLRTTLPQLEAMIKELEEKVADVDVPTLADEGKEAVQVANEIINFCGMCDRAAQSMFYICRHGKTRDFILPKYLEEEVCGLAQKAKNCKDDCMKCDTGNKYHV